MRRVPRSRRSPVPLVSSLHSFLCLSLRSDPVGNRALRARMTEGVVSERDTGAAGNHGNPLPSLTLRGSYGEYEVREAKAEGRSVTHQTKHTGQEATNLRHSL